jgi:GNAT superfamily N-acetyltransferase
LLPLAVTSKGIGTGRI